MTDPIPVSQRARDAFAALAVILREDGYSITKLGLSGVDEGLWDQEPEIQILARLEAAAYNDGLEAAAKVADAYGSGAGMQMGKGAMIAADTAAGIATDIRDLKGRV